MYVCLVCQMDNVSNCLNFLVIVFYCNNGCCKNAFTHTYHTKLPHKYSEIKNVLYFINEGRYHSSLKSTLNHFAVVMCEPQVFGLLTGF